MGNDAVNGHGIAVQAEAADDAETGRTEERMMPEVFPLVHIADVNLDNRALQ